jgi:hypothetical protein
MKRLLRILLVCAPATLAHAGEDVALPRPAVKNWTADFAVKSTEPFRGFALYQASSRERLVLTVAHRGPALRWSSTF